MKPKREHVNRSFQKLICKRCGKEIERGEKMERTAYGLLYHKKCLVRY